MERTITCTTGNMADVLCICEFHALRNEAIHFITEPSLKQQVPRCFLPVGVIERYAWMLLLSHTRPPSVFLDANISMLFTEQQLFPRSEACHLALHMTGLMSQCD